MKILKLMPILAVLFMLNVASMCSSDDDDSSSSVGTTQVTNSVTNGTWRVALYNEDGAVHTSNYSGYAFTFNSSGALAAISGAATKSGTWSTESDSGSTKFNIGFSDADGPFESISEDWKVLTVTSTRISLKHISGGDGGTDYLTFEKN